MLNDGITMVNTSSVAYTWSFEGGENYNESEGIVVDVYIDRVDIKARDFLAKNWLKTFSVPLPVKNGWIYSDGSWYFYSNNTKLTSWNMWNQNWYYLDIEGKMKTGWIYDENKWYYLDRSGVMKTKWIYDRGQWYYLNSNGDMKTGWHYENGNWYYLKPDGAMVTGSYNVGKMPYRFHADGTWISE
ncbi:N-acetylmuramoyl-L-alanine amidase family protein [Bacillus sp. BGMRC 2118]|nr:N-acetylmuramoyl-L-alanine amidase family protein [Bacillus sp. BGMRC 2118]